MRNRFLELKKIIVCCAILSGMILPAFSQSADPLFQKGVTAYRNGSTQECYEIMKVITKKDPSNGYAEYYLAMSYAKLGKLDEAKACYEKVVVLNQDVQLVSYAKEGIKNIEKAQGKEEKPDAAKEESFLGKLFAGKSSDESKSDKKEVSDEDIAKAIKVLRDAGLLNVQLGVGAPSASMAKDTPVNQEFLKQSSELMNLNMLMGTMSGGGSKNSGMDMLPFMLMQQQQGGNSNISPEMIQMLMNNTMLEGLSTFDTDDKNK